MNQIEKAICELRRLKVARLISITNGISFGELWGLVANEVDAFETMDHDEYLEYLGSDTKNALTRATNKRANDWLNRYENLSDDNTEIRF